MGDPEGSEPDKSWERYEEADSEEGPLGAITSIPKVAAEAFFAQTVKELGELVGHVALEWVGTQILGKATEAVETDRSPPDSLPPAAPVDMGTPAMGDPADPDDEEDAASPPWNPGGTSSEDDATAGPAAPSDDAGDDPPIPEAPSTNTAAAAALPDLNIGSPQWDPSANASGFAGPPDMPPIPQAPDPTE